MKNTTKLALLFAVVLPFWHLGTTLLRAQPKPPPAPADAPARPGAPAAPSTTTPPAATPPTTGGTAPEAQDPEEDYKPMPPRARVTFNLEDADLPELVRLISTISGRRFILPSKMRPIKATIVAPTKVTAAEAYRAFLSILQINGMTVVPSGPYLKIVETEAIENETIPVFTEGLARVGDDRYITQMHRLSNVSAEEITPLLEKFKSKEGSVSAYAPTNTLIITDTAANIRRIMRIVRTLDVAQSGTQIWVEPVHYANATEVAGILEEIFPSESGGGGNSSSARPRRPPSDGGDNTPSRTIARASSSDTSEGGGKLTKIFPDERTNSLIIMANEGAYLRVLELLKELDRPQEGEGRIHVHHLQHSDAEEVATVLSTLVSGNTPSSNENKGNNAAAGQADVFEGQIKITADKGNNALVITASLHDYNALRSVIERLDAARQQVFIEAVILELTIDRNTTFGIAGHSGVPDFPSDDSNTIFGFNAGNEIFGPSEEALTSLALNVRGPALEGSTEIFGRSVPSFGVALTAIAGSSDANVLSTPHIMAMDNEEAEITVGENVPLQTSGGSLGGLGSLAGIAGAAQGAGAAAGAGALPLGGLGFGSNIGVAPRQDIGTTVKITPHINESDQVRLEIAEEISELQGNPLGTLGVRTISKRTAKTLLSVGDQETIVIGGLMRDRKVVEKQKVPVLGDIPLLGALFRRTTTSKRKTNLLLILTPYIIRAPEDLRNIYERKMRERQDFIDRYFVFEGDYEPPVDYSRTRGLLAEISNEFNDRDQEQLLADELEARRPLEHAPKPPVGVPPQNVPPLPGLTSTEEDEGDGQPRTSAEAQTGQIQTGQIQTGQIQTGQIQTGLAGRTASADADATGSPVGAAEGMEASAEAFTLEN